MTLGSVSLEELREKFTEEEIVILLNTSKKYKYIVRHKEGDLTIFKRKPMRYKPYDGQLFWYSGDFGYDVEFDFVVFNHLFKNIKWEDEEPFKFR